MSTEPSDETVIKAMQWAERSKKESSRLDGILCPIEERDYWREKALMWRKYCRQANKGAMVNGLMARAAIDGQARWRKIAEEAERRATAINATFPGVKSGIDHETEASIWKGRHHDALTAYSEERIARMKAEHQAKDNEIEVGFLSDLLDQIQALVDGHGVGLRDSVREVLGKRSK